MRSAAATAISASNIRTKAERPRGTPRSSSAATMGDNRYAMTNAATNGKRSFHMIEKNQTTARAATK
jgi:hypothetical protein